MSLMDLKRITAEGGGTQMRASLNEQVVAEYADAIRDGVKFPAVTVFFDGTTHWLAEGFHRYAAHVAARKAAINVDLRQGSKRDAVLFATGANATHGLRRTNEDKRRAVRTLLDDPEWSQWSDREIAKQCDVSHTFVASLRAPEVATLPPKSADKVATLPGNEHHAAGNVATEVPEKVAPKAPAAGNVATAANDEKDDQLAESAHTITELASEVEALKAQIAVGALPAEDQPSAAEIIEDLRNQVKSLTAELDAMRVSRDTFQRENRELMKQVGINSKELKKLRAA